MKPLLIIGSAPCVDDDMKRVSVILFRQSIEYDEIDCMVVGLSSLDKFHGRINYIANNHPENIPLIRRIMQERHEATGGNWQYKIIGPAPGPGVDIVEPYRPPTGSSAITGALAAIRMGYRKIILAGCPLTGNAPAGNPYEEFRAGWEAKKDELVGIIKSASGWTRELLGEPTAAWLKSAAVEHEKNSPPPVLSTLTRWDYLIALARAYGWRRGAELGVWYGKTFFNLLGALPDLHLTGVDCWLEVAGSDHHRDCAANRAEVIRRQASYRERSVLLEMKTMDAAAAVPDGSLDFVFIDAAHDYASVCEDIDAWRPKVKSGGFLTGHDQDWPTVDAAVRDRLGRVQIYSAGGDCMWAWRQP